MARIVNAEPNESTNPDPDVDPGEGDGGGDTATKPKRKYTRRNSSGTRASANTRTRGGARRRVPRVNNGGDDSRRDSVSRKAHDYETAIIKDVNPFMVDIAQVVCMQPVQAFIDPDTQSLTQLGRAVAFSDREAKLLAHAAARAERIKGGKVIIGVLEDYILPYGLLLGAGVVVAFKGVAMYSVRVQVAAAQQQQPQPVQPVQTEAA